MPAHSQTSEADSAKMQVDTAEMSNVYLNYKNAVTQSWTALGIAPSTLADSAKSPAEKEKFAATHIENYFDKLVKNEVQFVEVPYPVARALQTKYDFAVNDAGLDKVLERAKSVRATADSLRAQQAPKPGAGAPGAAPAAPVTPPPAKPPAQKP